MHLISRMASTQGCFSLLTRAGSCRAFGEFSNLHLHVSARGRHDRAPKMGYEIRGTTLPFPGCVCVWGGGGRGEEKTCWGMGRSQGVGLVYCAIARIGTSPVSRLTRFYLPGDLILLSPAQPFAVDNSTVTFIVSSMSPADRLVVSSFFFSVTMSPYH